MLYRSTLTLIQLIYHDHNEHVDPIQWFNSLWNYFTSIIQLRNISLHVLCMVFIGMCSCINCKQFTVSLNDKSQILVQ